MQIFEKVFNKYMINKPGEKPFFSMESFNIFMKDMSLDTFADEVDYGYYFNMACQIHVDETKTDNHFKIRNKLEFFEC